MANNAGARKAIRKIEARTEVNKARRTRVRTYLRKFQEALTGGDVEAAKGAFITAQSELMRAVSKGVVHKNTGSRKVSRLAAQLKKLPIDVINGSPLLREWVDDPAATPADLDALTLPDEAAWIEERKPFLLY